MSNDTQVQAHTALAKECGAITYTHRSNPHEAAVSFGPMAWEKFVEASARQLAEQPGFVMVPTVEELADKIASMLHGTYHCTRVWNAWNVGTMSQDDFEPLDESETPTEIAAEIHALLTAARPLTASPTAPSTEQRPQNCGTGFCSCIECPYEPSTEASEPVGEREAFEAELRKLCFQKPTTEAYDLAWSVWQARASKGTPL